MTRLDGFIRRLHAQVACLDAARSLVAPLSGAIYELGLGNGRTYDHLRALFPDRTIVVFESDSDAVNEYAISQGKGILLCLGDVEVTLADRSLTVPSPVALVHNDLGDWDHDAQLARTARIVPLLVPRLATGAIFVSNVPLDAEHLVKLNLPLGVRPDKYHMYRHQPISIGARE
jgi:hypothetical protein